MAMPRLRALTTAYHEAGHIVVAALEDPPEIVNGVRIVADPASSNAAGVTDPIVRMVGNVPLALLVVADTPDEREACEKELRFLVAGEEAALRIDPEYPGAIRAADDRHRALELARKLTRGQYAGTPELVEKARVEVRQILDSPATWERVTVVATALLARGQLGREDLLDLLTPVGRSDG